MALGLAMGLAVIGGWLGWTRWRASADGREDSARFADELGEYVPVRVADIVAGAPARMIYLNREGARLTAGRDDSKLNRSSIVQGAGLTHADFPAFQGSPRRWSSILECVRERFAPFDVRIVDQRPVRGDYVMVMVGGHPRILDGGEPRSGHEHVHATGLAPYNGRPVTDAIVMVFSRRLREHPRRTCETIAMEAAHAYGLDHAMHCGDLMSYLRPCGRRRFRDEDLPCGEHQARTCDGFEGTTQNSHRRLLGVFGPAADRER